MPTYFPPLSPAEMQALQQMVYSAIRSLTTSDALRLQRGRPPQYTSRIQFYNELIEKLKV